MIKIAWQKWLVFAMCFLLLETTAQGDGAPTCGEKIRAAQDVIEASDVEIRHLKMLHESESILVKQLTEQRDEAFAKAKETPGPWIPTEVWIAVAFVAGAAFGVKILR